MQFRENPVMIYDNLLNSLQWETPVERLLLLDAKVKGEFMDCKGALWTVRETGLKEKSSGHLEFGVTEDRGINVYIGDKGTTENGCFVVHLKLEELDLMFIYGKLSYSTCPRKCFIS